MLFFGLSVQSISACNEQLHCVWLEYAYLQPRRSRKQADFLLHSRRYFLLLTRFIVEDRLDQFLWIIYQRYPLVHAGCHVDILFNQTPLSCLMLRLSIIVVHFKANFHCILFFKANKVYLWLIRYHSPIRSQVFHYYFSRRLPKVTSLLINYSCSIYVQRTSIQIKQNQAARCDNQLKPTQICDSSCLFAVVGDVPGGVVDQSAIVERPPAMCVNVGQDFLNELV